MAKHFGFCVHTLLKKNMIYIKNYMQKNSGHYFMRYKVEFNDISLNIKNNSE